MIDYVGATPSMERRWSENEHAMRAFLDFNLEEELFGFSERNPYLDDSIPMLYPSTLPTSAPIKENGTMLSTKRKSEDWDSKPLEKRCVYTNKFVEDLNTFPEEYEEESDLGDVADLFFDLQLPSSDADTKGLLKVKSESWDVQSDRVPSDTEHIKQKRTKWLKTEVCTLWEGILTHGNNWRAIKREFLHNRTYYQVKDKGRRILASQGWITGRTKNDTDDASDDAKEIARQVLSDPARLSASSSAC